MRFKAAVFFGCAAAVLSPFAGNVLHAQEAADAAAAEAPVEVDEALEQEIRYVEELIKFGFPDFAGPVIEATKKKWPESEARFFAIEIRGMLSMGQFDEAEAKIAALPDRTGAKYWAARLEAANNFFYNGKKAECSKIYDEFFKAFPKPTKEIREFYLQACYAWGQLLAGDKRFEEAVKVYAQLLTQINKRRSEEDANTWCNVACETAEMYLKLATDIPDVKKRSQYLTPAKKIIDALLWEQDRHVYFGRAIALRANYELLRGDVAKAQETINEYMPQLEAIHQSIVEFDPDGKHGLRKFSAMPLCRFMLAKMLWQEAQDEYKKPKRDDERVKSLLFGAKAGNRRNGLGAYNHALNVFIQYPESTWAPDAGELESKIKEFAEKSYGAKITSKVTGEQIKRVREMQFLVPADLLAEGQTEKGIAEYLDVIGRYPETVDAVRGIEKVVGAYLDLIATEKDSPKQFDWRIDADAIEGYLGERFAGCEDRELMTMAGDAVMRIAALEKQRGQLARSDRLYREFLMNYTNHVGAATIASSMISQCITEEKWNDALALCKVVQEYYRTSLYYAASFSQASYCYGKIGDKVNAVSSMKRYVEVEKDGISREQARMALAQMYQGEGFDIMANADTNTTPEAVSEALRAGSVKIIHGIRQFREFAGKADKALADPSLTKADKARYSELKEKALYHMADCWRRMTKPEAKLEMMRKNAAAGFEEYLAAYPEGRFSTNSYVRLGTIYTALGDTEKARDALTRLAAAFPQSLEAKNAKPQLAKSLIEMGMRKEGAEIYAEMLRTDGSYTARQFVSAGEALIDARSWDLAGQAFAKAIAKAGTNNFHAVARARIGEAKSLFRQKNYIMAKESLDAFLEDKKMSRMGIAVDAQRLMIDVASALGSSEKDTKLRNKYFGEAVAAVKALRNHWSEKPQWEKDSVDLMSAEVKIDQMNAEEKMGLREEAAASRSRAASMLQSFLQSRGVSEDHPADKMSGGELKNLERCYADMVPLFAAMGKEQADRVLKYGQEYLELFPNGKDRTLIQNCINGAKAYGVEIPSAGESPAAPAAEDAPPSGNEPPAAEEQAAPAAPAAGENEDAPATEESVKE